MAKANLDLTVALEKVIFDAFKDAAQHIADEHGIQVNSVRFDWLDSSTMAGRKISVDSISCDAKYSCKLE